MEIGEISFVRVVVTLVVDVSGRESATGKGPYVAGVCEV